MTIPNCIPLDDLPTMPVGQIADLPGDQLALLKQDADERLRSAKTLCDWLDGAIALKYGDDAQEVRCAEGKDTGTVRLQDGQVDYEVPVPSKETIRAPTERGELARLELRLHRGEHAVPDAVLIGPRRVRPVGGVMRVLGVLPVADGHAEVARPLRRVLAGLGRARAPPTSRRPTEPRLDNGLAPR